MRTARRKPYKTRYMVPIEETVKISRDGGAAPRSGRRCRCHSAEPSRDPARRGSLIPAAKPRLRFRQPLRDRRGAGSSGRRARSHPQAPPCQVLNQSQLLAGPDSPGPHLKGNKEARGPRNFFFPAASKVVSVEGVHTDYPGRGCVSGFLGSVFPANKPLLILPNRM